MRERQLFKYGPACRVSDTRAQFRRPKQNGKSLQQLFESIRGDEPAILSVLNHLGDPLPLTGNHGFARRHSFQIYASQAFIPTGQNEYRAPSHGLGYFGPALPADKLNLPPNAQVARQPFKLGAIRPFSDDATSKLWEGGSEMSERS